MNGQHPCPNSRCEHQVSDQFFACRWCWTKLPMELKRKILRECRSGQREGKVAPSEAYMNAAKEAKKFFEELKP